MIKNSVYRIYFASCMNIIFNELCQQRQSDGCELTYCRKASTSLAVGAYTIAQFICTILCSAYTTLLQKLTRYACDYRTY